LIGGARTDLSGLTADEARTLFLVAGPASAATPEVKAALRKLIRALPETFRADAEAAAGAVVLDPASWDRRRFPPPPHLEPLQRAVVDGVQVQLAYAGREGTPSERTIHPLGLVVKANVWYLVADTEKGLRTFRVDRVRDLTLTDEPVVRPEGFDLSDTWRDVLESIEEKRAAYKAEIRVHPDLLGWVVGEFGTRMTVTKRPPSGLVEVEVRGAHPRHLAGQLASFGANVEVIGPNEVREELAKIGAELVDAYA
jgi:predicted DNA-binding transcriptional regulator YafY